MATVRKVNDKRLLKRTFLVIISVLLLLFIGNKVNHVYAVTDNTNPFRIQDKQWTQNVQNAVSQVPVQSSTYTFSRKATQRMDNSLTTYIVKFSPSVELNEIYNCVKDYSYTMLGKSELRVFQIQIDNIEEFKLIYKDIIECCEENQVLHTMDVIPDDSKYSLQWAIPDMKLPQAWEITKGSSSVKVAVLDTGFSRTTQDFNASSILAGCDITGDGGPVNNDTVGHGTAVTSVIAAKTNNSYGMAGVCWDVTIVPYKLDIADGNLSSAAIIKALYMAADADCDVINMSFGSVMSDPLMNDAIQYAREKGCILVAAAGNDGRSVLNFPASYSGVISVGAVDKNNIVASFSQYNEQIDVVAPGKMVVVNKAKSTDNTGLDNFIYGSGTSYASPYVVGVAALVKSLDKSVTSDDFNSLLAKTSTDLGTTGYDVYHGWGLIDASQILKVLNGSVIINNSPLVTDTESGVIFNKDTGAVVGWRNAKSELNIPSSIDGIDVTSIGDAAFIICNSLKAVTIPSTVKTIGCDAFLSCEKLSDLNISNGVTTIEAGAFNGCSSLQKLSLPPSVTTVEYATFNFCDLTEVTLSNGLLSIGDYAFNYNKNLTTINIPASVTTIGVRVFVGNRKLQSISVDPQNNSYKSESGVLYSKDGSILYVYPNANGTSYSIPDTVNKIDSSAFSDCDDLTSITIPGSVSTIEVATFQDCNGLTNVTLQEGIRVISKGAFNGCSSLTNIFIPSSIEQIDGNVFTCCDKLSSIVVDINNLVYKDINGVLFGKNGTQLISYPNAMTSTYTVPDDVTEIAEEAFYDCDNLKSLIVSKTVVSLGARCLTNCSKLLNIYFEGNNPVVANEWNRGVNRNCVLYKNVDSNGFTTSDGLWEGLPLSTYCNLTFSSLGGTEVQTQKIVLNNVITEPPTPVNIGQLFLGWYTSKDNGVQITFPYTVTKNETLYDQWTLASYTVSFDSQEGSLVKSQDITYKNMLKEPDKPSKTGYSFKGWYTEASGGSKITFPYQVTKEITLYAQWIPNSYPVSFDSRGGSLVPSQDVTYNTMLKEPTKPSKIGYSFKGWYTEASGGSKIIFPYQVVREITLYAQWIPNSYPVSFDSNGGSLVPSQNITYNTMLKEPVKPSKTGYKFKGWYTEASGGSKITFPYQVTKEITLYANWEPITYLVSFKTQGGSSVSSQFVAYGVKVSKPVNPVRAGYVFAGWYNDSNLKQSWNFKTDRISKNMILYAKWTRFSPQALTGMKIKSVSYKEIQISWNRVPGATGYRIYCATSKNGKYTLVTSVSSLSFTNSELTLGKTYYYKVVAYQTVGKVTTVGKYSKVVSAKPVLIAPTSLKVTKLEGKRASITWAKVYGASGYVVYRATSLKGSYKAITTTSSNKFTNKGLVKGRTYYYKVMSYRVVDGKRVYSKTSNIVKIKMK